MHFLLHNQIVQWFRLIAWCGYSLLARTPVAASVIAPLLEIKCKAGDCDGFIHKQTYRNSTGGWKSAGDLAVVFRAQL